jgi:hypothetical protein
MDFELLQHCPYVEKSFMLTMYESLGDLAVEYCEWDDDSPEPELLPFMNKTELNKLREDYVMIAEDGIFK